MNTGRQLRAQLSSPVLSMDRGTSLEKVSVRHEFCPIFVSSCLCEYVGLFLSGDETFYSESRHTASEVLSDTFKVVWVCNTALCFLISYTTAGSCQISSVSFQPESHTLTHKHMQRTKRWHCTVCPSCMGIQMLRLSTPAFPLLSQADICLFKLLLQHPERPSDSF